MSQTDKPGLFSLHPHYRQPLRGTVAILLVLALIQLLAWLLPSLPEFNGIPNYLPLHVLLETVSIVVSMMVFAVGWNSRSSNLSGNIVLLACVFFAVGVLDFLHTVSYGGMPAFISSNDAQKHLNFWLSARFFASVVLLVVVIRPWKPLAFKASRYVIFASLIFITGLINWAVVYHQAWMPDTFIPGQGLTPFKKNTEYLIIAFNIVTAAILWHKMREKQTFNVVLLFGAVCTLAMSEFFFTLYTTMTGSYNVLGHIYKVIAYLFIYRALVVETIEEPFDKLALAQQNLATSLQASSTGLWDWNVQTNEVIYSPEWKAQLGYQSDELPNHFSTWESRLHPDDREAALNYVQSFTESGTQLYENEFRLRHRDGSYRWIMTRGEKQLDANGKLVRLIGSHIDISERKVAEQRIQQLANFDMLTGLPNRMLFKDRVQQAISAGKRDRSRFAILFFDLDHFKDINDTLGHHIGDELLVNVGQRLSATVREKDTVSRMGGDEFIMLLTDSDIDGAVSVAKKLLATIAEPCRIEQNELVVTPSIGISMYPEDGEDFDTLYRHADVAMYSAKRKGRNDYRFFTQEMQSHSIRTLKIENALRHAVERNELYLHYQPQLAIADGRVIGVEALLRWQHPEMGMVSPAEFIPIAEKSGQIIKIGEWVLRTAVRQLKTWHDRELPHMTMAVNLSAVQFRHSNLPGLVSSILEEAQLPPQYLELELTEGVAMDDPERAITVMDDLHARGVRMSLDDFGTGYSSLNYLKKFNIYKLKIDQTFVRDITRDEDDKAIVSAIILMARGLNFLTIAEGVETVEQLEFLRECGCNEVQGYYFSKPVSAEQFEAFVNNSPKSIMAAFRYEALDSTGRNSRGVIEADTLRQARANLRESGLTVVAMEALTQDTLQAGAGASWRERFSSGISSAQLSLMTRQLATLLAASLTLEQALNALIEQSESETARQVLAGVRAEVLAGHTLAQALGKYERVFPDIYRSLVKAGEASGELGQVMLRLADYTESRQALQQKVGLAFVYPAIVTAVALLVVTGLLMYVVPQVVSVFQQSHQSLPLLTRILIGLSSGLQATWPYLLGLIVAAVFLARMVLQREEIRYQWHLQLLRMPVVGRLVRGVNAARMASTLAILSGSGVPLLTALQAAAGVVNNLPMQRALEDAAKKVREGVELSRALAVSKLFPPILIHLIASGESSGKLDVMLERAATQQEQEVGNYTSVLTALLEPLLILTMGVVVLLIVLAILMPIIDMNQMVR